MSKNSNIQPCLFLVLIIIRTLKSQQPAKFPSLDNKQDHRVSGLQIHQDLIVDCVMSCDVILHICTCYQSASCLAHMLTCTHAYVYTCIRVHTRIRVYTHTHTQLDLLDVKSCIPLPYPYEMVFRLQKGRERN